jgi:protoheme IX farnesyltransferase
VTAVLRVRSSLSARIGAFIALTKPRIILLLLITTVPTMVLAAGGLPSFGLIAATLLGGTLAAGGANAINQYLDRDIDARMSRTSRRPIPSHRVAPSSALAFGAGLGVVAFLFLVVTVNLLAAALSLGALLFYVFVYTLWMKRSTPQNIVVGGAAGAAPVLVGWAAVTGRVEAPALVLFAIVFCWTPPHFWALALRYRDDYAAVGVPMLPVVAGERRTTSQILLYSIQLAALTLLLYPAGRMGLLYLAAATILSARFVALAWALWRKPGVGAAMRLFKYSIYYLALLFVAVAVDQLLPWP